MTPARRRTVLFLLCAAVLLAAGFAWGSAHAYDRFYAPEAVLDREIVHLDFNNRVLHYLNLGQRETCRRELVTRLRQESVYIRGLAAAASVDARTDAGRKLRQSERVIAGRGLNDDPPPAALTHVP